MTPIEEIGLKLLKWYKENKRDFPWREDNANIYEILVAEILLRKTTAKMVADFFPNFLKKYPNINKIKNVSKSKLEEDLKPLGLYKTRAEIFKSLAEELVEKFEGKIPDQYEDLISLNGIGKYIANAVLCFGFKKEAILVDTNINRVFSRILNKKYPIKILDNHPLWQEIEVFIAIQNYISFFYAMIDFGSIICKKKIPRCSICPIIAYCKYNNKCLANK